MKRNYIFLFIVCFSFCNITLKAQTLEEAKKLFQQKEYEKAKPVFQKHVKSNPNNGSYNYWYGVCCYETGEKAEAEKYLLVGAKRKVQEAFRYLGQLYFEQYRFEESEEYYDEYITLLEKAKKPTEEFEILSEKAKVGARMLKGVEEVTFIDSFVVNKKDFLDTYKISEESGQIMSYADFFNKNPLHSGTVYQTELENKLYYANANEDNGLDIYTSIKLSNEWGKPALLPDAINTPANENYPYVLSDGVTIYYASDGENSLGGYDIFVTRYNTVTDTYLVPDNIGMPFNSPFNDYMYVVDEFNNLGWFASDRYQPEDTVCIYVFIPNSSKQTYNYETTDVDSIRHAAIIHSIGETVKDEDEVKAAKQRLAAAKYYKPEEKVKHDFIFIIDDNTTYYKLDDFTSPAAKSKFTVWQQKQKDFEKISNQLQQQRDTYTKSDAASRSKLAPAILDLEKRVEQMEIEVKQIQKEIRNEENKKAAK